MRVCNGLGSNSTPKVNFHVGVSKPDNPKAETNGICERFHKTILNEFYRVTFRKEAVQDH